MGVCLYYYISGAKIKQYLSQLKDFENFISFWGCWIEIITFILFPFAFMELNYVKSHGCPDRPSLAVSSNVHMQFLLTPLLCGCAA